MDKETITVTAPAPPGVTVLSEADDRSVRTMPMDKAKELIRKTAAEHAGRRLAK